MSDGEATEQTLEVSLDASAAHRRELVGLVAGLVGFAWVYTALLVGCVAAGVLLVRLTLAQAWLWALVGPALLVFGVLVFVLVRGLVHRPAPPAGAIELDPVTQPRLFAFVADLAGRTRAPEPDAIKLVPGVNAAMLRSSSALGLLFGGQRELVLGLGLIQVVDVAELEAILAHELGHFAQSSARVGQWAHRTAMVLRSIVLERDQLDERLARARRSSSVGVRAAVAVPSLGVAGLRGLLGRMLISLERSSLALARELEFNADLHAVARCGSDAIVAALWRVQRGALAMDASLAALRELAKHGLISDDLYVHLDARAAEFDAQTPEASTPMLAALRRPYVPGPERHFPPGEAPAEVMAYSHPTYAEREANAKARYVPGRPAPAEGWAPAASLLDDLARLRAEATTLAYARFGVPAEAPRQPAADVEDRLAEELAERAQGRRYFGFYANRIIAVPEPPLEAANAEVEPETLARLAAAAAPWRGGPELEAFMQRWRATDAALDRLGDRLRNGTSEPETFAWLREAEQAREQERAEAEAGDRAVFRWLWAEADADQRGELERRARTLAFVQDQIVTLNHHRRVVMALLGLVDNDAARAELEEALAALHADLEVLLAAAEAHPLPELRHLEAGASTREFLLSDPLVPVWAPDGREPLGAWVGRFLPQVTRVHDRLRTLHFKNLGRLLGLFEAIELGSNSDRGVVIRTPMKP